MNLNLSLWRSQAPFEKIIHNLKKNKLAKASGIASVALPSLIYALWQENFTDNILIISSYDQPNAIHKLANQISRLSEADTEREVKIDTFPTSQVSPFDGLPESERHFNQISRILSKWLHQKPSITICSAKSLSQAVCPKEEFLSSEINLQKNQENNLSELLNKLIEGGYERVESVLDVGTFSLRGDILDIFPANQADALPLRINFFGDEIETIKPFEPWTQRSLSGHEIEITTISPIRPFKLPLGESKKKLEGDLRKMAEEIEETQSYFWLEDLRKFTMNEISGGEWQRFIPWVQPNSVSPLNYFPENGLIIIDEPSSLKARIEQIFERNKVELEHKLERKNLPISQKELLEKFIGIPQFIEDELANKKVLEIMAH